MQEAITPKYHYIEMLQACAITDGVTGLPDDFSEGHLLSITQSFPGGISSLQVFQRFASWCCLRAAGIGVRARLRCSDVQESAFRGLAS